MAVTSDMDVLDRFREVVQSADVGKVFGAPIIRDDVVVVPVARIRTGVGGGSGTGPAAEGGTGGGYGIVAKPLGVFVITDGKVRWHPVVDINVIIMGGQLIAVTALLVSWSREGSSRPRRTAPVDG